LFASILLIVIGCFNLIQGIAAIAHSHVFVSNAHYVFANQRTWGWITLILGCLQLLAALGVLAGNQLARWFAVVVLGLNAIDQMLFIPAYPFWSLTIIAMDVVALWGLCAYGSRANLEAA
jgi:endonuclease/exonuclease/phosphatase (EEP) superfamily protein YafD